MEDFENVFSSSFTLFFKDKDIESKYTTVNKKHLRRNNIIYNSIFIAFSLAIDILMINYDGLRLNFYLTLISFVTSGLQLLCLLASLLLKRKSFQNWICYTCYTLAFIKFTLLRYFFTFLLKADISLFSLVMSVELLIRITWFQTGSLDFSEGLLCTVVIMILNYALFFWGVPRNIHFRGAVYCIVLLVMIIIAYFYVKEKRKNFYLNIILRKKNDWYNSVLENINSGFIKIEKSKLTFSNASFKRLFDVIYHNSKGVTLATGIEENNIRLNTSSYILTDDIVSTVMLNLFKAITDGNESLSYEEVLTILEGYYLQSNSSNFYFLGRASYNYNSNNGTPSSLYYEVYGRCLKENQSNDYTYEFIFNDISKIKIIEESNAEIKYKSLFLAKVAHEFKNPILCITELIAQIFDELNHSISAPSHGQIRELLSQIQSISDYLIILIKDLDYFSQKFTGGTSRTQVDNSVVATKDIINFCKNITLALIKKLQKDSSVEFSVTEDHGIPDKLYVDEIKLKQVLINLLSNAVKYTNQGCITLSIVNNDNGSVRFSIKDTGKGITDVQKNKLFKPFSIDTNSQSAISTGLGLYIVKELIELIGSKLDFSSEIEKGSEFWFVVSKPEGLEDSSDRHSNDVFERISVSSDATVCNEFSPAIPDYLYKQIYNGNNQPSCDCSINRNWNNLRTSNSINIILIDDELLPRQSCLRLIKKYFTSRSINANILEGNDGIDCLMFVYQAIVNKVKIDFIISDENMNFLNGLESASILEKIYRAKVLKPIPFYILSAHEGLNGCSSVQGIFSKPFNENKLDYICSKNSNVSKI
jgi:nitrogen-specific signal transduction histidine kinase